MKTLTAVLFVCALPVLWGQSANPPSASTGQGNSLLIRGLNYLGPADPAPIGKGERFQNYVVNMAGPLAILGEAAGAGIGQWNDSPHEWGQGGEGFGRRFGSNMAYNAVRQTIMYGASEALHEDNRYFASGKSSTWARCEYALLSPAMARKRNGKRGVSISSLLGLAGAATLSLTWSPPSWQGADRAARNFGTSYASVAGVNLVREFIPDLIRRLRR